MGQNSLGAWKLKEAFDLFIKAYKTLNKREKEKKCQAALKLGQVCRKFASGNFVENERLKRIIFGGASCLVIELKTGTTTSLSLQLALELGKVKEVYYQVYNLG